MADPQVITLSLNKRPSDEHLVTGAQPDWPVGLVADYRFLATDTYLIQKNGFVWDGGNRTISTPPGSTEKGGIFSFPATPDPRVDCTAEQRFTFDGLTEFWIKLRFYIPTNYFHRKCLHIEITGDISSWQLGDNIIAANGVDSGPIYFITGQSVFLLFATNELVDSGVWTGNVTNQTRAQIRASVRNGVEADNNKFLALWCDEYSSSGAGPTIAFELHADELGGSTIYYHFGADYNVVGILPNSTSTDKTFIRTSDLGKWFNFIVHVKMASSESAEDGIIEYWLKRDGESTYTRLDGQANAKIGQRAASGTFKTFRKGYTHGWSNSGFADAMNMYDSRFMLSTTAIDGVS